MTTDKSAEREAFDYATRLAQAIHAKHYSEVTQWRPLPDLLGVLTQIDNMTCGLARAARAALPQQAQAPRCNEVFKALELDPDRYTTEGGAINIPKLRATIKHPSEYLPPDHWMNSPR